MAAIVVLVVISLVVVQHALKTPRALDTGRVVGGSSQSASAPQDVVPTQSTASTPSPTAAAALPVVALGDSITQADSFAAEGVLGHSWFADLVESDPNLRYAWNAGRNGNTTTQMLDRVDTEVLAHQPAVVFVMGGTNDIGRLDEANTIENLTAITTRLKAADVRVVLFSINPRGAAHFAPLVQSLNAAIRQLAADQGVGYVNTHDAVANRHGVYRPGLSADGTHPTVAGQQLMANAALPQLARLGL